MTVTSGYMPAPNPSDNVKGNETVIGKFTVAAPTFNYNPTLAATSVQVENFSTVHSLAITIFGIVNGVNTNLGTQLVQPRQLETNQKGEPTVLESTSVPIENITARAILQSAIASGVPITNTVPATAAITALQVFDAEFAFSNA